MFYYHDCDFIMRGQVSSKLVYGLFYTENDRFTDHKLTSVRYYGGVFVQNLKPGGRSRVHETIQGKPIT